VGGLVGSLLIGLFADPEFFGASNLEGLFYGGGLQLLGEQALANAVAIVYSFVITALIMLVLKRTMGVRVDEEIEVTGLDLALHSEIAYHTGAVGGSSDLVEAGRRVPV
jgi:Amt family ammonium transporter